MKPSRGVKRGNDFLPHTGRSDIEAMLKKTPAGKQRERLHAALLRKQGKSEKEIAEILHRSKSTVSEWLNRFEREVQYRPATAQTAS